MSRVIENNSNTGDSRDPETTTNAETATTHSASTPPGTVANAPITIFGYETDGVSLFNAANNLLQTLLIIATLLVMTCKCTSCKPCRPCHHDSCNEDTTSVHKAVDRHDQKSKAGNRVQQDVHPSNERKPEEQEEQDGLGNNDPDCWKITTQ